MFSIRRGLGDKINVIKVLQRASLTGLSYEDAKSCCSEPYPETKGYIMQQTTYRVKSPRLSLDFYTRMLGMRLLKKLDFPETYYSMYFLGYEDADDIPIDENERTRWLFSRKATIELIHTWGTENNSVYYHNGNREPLGYGHIGIMVPNVDEACTRLYRMGARIKKRPNDGKLLGIGYILDPDGYWIEILNNDAMAEFWKK